MHFDKLYEIHWKIYFSGKDYNIFTEKWTADGDYESIKCQDALWFSRITETSCSTVMGLGTMIIGTSGPRVL